MVFYIGIVSTCKILFNEFAQNMNGVFISTEQTGDSSFLRKF
jgi:hypothetical protein